jgi:predicted RNA-binding Zn-ribbon protein involved in translation (DUF1610 family)
MVTESSQTEDSMANSAEQASPTNSTQPTIEYMDARVSACPSCGATLKKVPGAKTKCPACGEYMFVRTDPRNNCRVVVTQFQAEEIDDEWAKVNGTWDELLAGKERIEEARTTLRDKFGQDSSDSDVLWRLGNENMIDHANQRQWGLYRNDLYELADVARKDGNYKIALQLYLDVCYIDTNGPNNVGLWSDGTPVPGEDNWQIEMGFLAPVPLGYLVSLSQKLGQPLEQSLSEYAPRALKLQSDLKFPLDWESSRTIIIKALENQ